MPHSSATPTLKPELGRATGREGAQFTQPTEIRSKKRKRAKRPQIPEKYKKAMERLPSYQEEMKRQRKRWTVNGFRNWLRKLPNPIVLDEDFANWWNNIYRRQLRKRVDK